MIHFVDEHVRIARQEAFLTLTVGDATEWVTVDEYERLYKVAVHYALAREVRELECEDDQIR